MASRATIGAIVFLLASLRSPEAPARVTPVEGLPFAAVAWPDGEVMVRTEA